MPLNRSCLCQKGKPQIFACKINSQYRIQIENNRYILACLIDALVLCGKQNIAIRGHEENKSNNLAILQYRAKSDELLQRHLNDKTKKTRYLSPKIQNELLDMSAEQIRRDIVRDCNNAACFALIADKATDSSTKEQISLCVRFVDRQADGNIEIREEFLGFVQAKSLKGEQLAEQFLESLNRYGIQVDKIQAQAYDGASNMSGKHMGAQAVVQQYPLATCVHCKAHCLNLAITKSCNLPLVRNMMGTVQEFSFAFGYSAKRLLAFQEEIKTDGQKQEELGRRSKIRMLYETRWSARADALFTFRSAFALVVHSLEELKEDNDKNAWNLLNAILKFDFILSVVVVEHILQSTVQLSLSLQRVDTDLVQASTEAEVVVALLRQERADDTVWETLYDRATEIAAANEIAPSSPGRRGRQAHRSNTP